MGTESEWELAVGVPMGMGMMWDEIWELNEKRGFWYGNVRKWEFGAHSRSPLPRSLKNWTKKNHP